MMRPLWAKLILADRFPRRTRPRSFKSKGNRLRLEQLENRLFMNADNPLAASSLLSGQDALQTVATVSSSVNDTTNAPWQRFQSTEELEAWLVEGAVARWQHLFGQTNAIVFCGDIGSGGTFTLTRTDQNTANFLAISNMSMASLDAASISNTNLQVAGVDEADLVETDGEFLYIISGNDLVIVEAGTGDNFRVASRVHLQERPTGMYLSGNRLTLISTGNSASEMYFSPGIQAFLPWQMYPNDFPGSNPTTTVTVLDITDRALPTLVQKTELDGQLITSRVVDGELRLVLSNQHDFPMPIVVESTQNEVSPYEPQEGDPAQIRLISRWTGNGAGRYETKEEYLARIHDQLISWAHPHIRELTADGEVTSETALFEPQDLYRPDSLVEGYITTIAITTIATFDLMSDDPGVVATANVITTNATTVYATEDNVYLFAPEVSGANTDVWKFSLNGETHAVDLVAKGKFAGSLLNQFSADEHEGYLRVVATLNGSGQSIDVLQQVGSEIQVVGSVTGIAPNESLYSVRFMGSRAFLTTFRRIDPLFAVDLNDPTNPKVLGQLHIAGYSDYLQPIDENHLLAIGRGANETTGFFEELQVSLFDVSDLSNPQLMHRYSFAGGRSTVTPATGDRWQRGDGDHHSVAYFASEHTLAIPIYTNHGMWDDILGVNVAPVFEAGDNGLQLLKIDLDNGFTPITLIEHDTLITRSVSIGDRLFAISSGMVSVHAFADPSVRIDEIRIDGNSDIEPITLTMKQPLIRWAEQPPELPFEPPFELPPEMPEETETPTEETQTTQIDLTEPPVELPLEKPQETQTETATIETAEEETETPTEIAAIEAVPTESVAAETEQPTGQPTLVTPIETLLPDPVDADTSESPKHSQSAPKVVFIDPTNPQHRNGTAVDHSSMSASRNCRGELSQRTLSDDGSKPPTVTLSQVELQAVDAYMNQIGRMTRRQSKSWSSMFSTDLKFAPVPVRTPISPKPSHRSS